LPADVLDVSIAENPRNYEKLAIASGIKLVDYAKE
jgi:hypothetical protein